MVVITVKKSTEPTIVWKDASGKVHVSTLSYYQKVLKSGGKITVRTASGKIEERNELPVAVDKIRTPDGRVIDFKSGKSDWMPLIYKKTEKGYVPADVTTIFYGGSKQTAEEAARWHSTVTSGRKYYYSPTRPTDAQKTQQVETPSQAQATTPMNVATQQNYPHIPKYINISSTEVLHLLNAGRPYTMKTVENGIPAEIRGVIFDPQHIKALEEKYRNTPHTYYVWKDNTGRTVKTWDTTPESIDSVAEALYYGYKPKAAEVKYALVGNDKIPVGVRLILEPTQKEFNIPAKIDLRSEKIIIPSNAPITQDKIKVTIEKQTEKGTKSIEKWFKVERGNVTAPNTSITVRLGNIDAKAEDWKRAREMNALYTYIVKDLRKGNVLPYVAGGFVSWKDPFNLKTIYYGLTGQYRQVINTQYEKMKEFYRVRKETKGNPILFVGKTALTSPTSVASAGAYVVGAGTAGAIGLLGRISPAAATWATRAIQIGGGLLAASYVAEPVLKKDYAEAMARAGVVAVSIPFAYAGAQAAVSRLMPKARVMRIDAQAEQFSVKNKGGIYAEITAQGKGIEAGGKYVANYDVVHTDKIHLPTGATLRHSIITGDVVGDLLYKTPYGKYTVHVRTPYATGVYDIIPKGGKRMLSIITTYSRAGEYRGFANTAEASSLLRIGGLYTLDVAVRGQPTGKYYVVEHVGVLAKQTTRGLFGRTLLNYVDLTPPRGGEPTTYTKFGTFRIVGGKGGVARLMLQTEQQSVKTLPRHVAEQLLQQGARIVGSKAATQFTPTAGTVATVRGSGSTVLLLKQKTSEVTQPKTIEVAPQRIENRPTTKTRETTKQILEPINIYKQTQRSGTLLLISPKTTTRTRTQTRTRTRSLTRTELLQQPVHIENVRQGILPATTPRTQTKTSTKVGLSLKLRTLLTEETLFKEATKTTQRLWMPTIRIPIGGVRGFWSILTSGKRTRTHKQTPTIEYRKTIYADYWSIHKSVVRFGKATQPAPTLRVWNIAERTRYMRVPTAELLRKSRRVRRKRKK